MASRASKPQDERPNMNPNDEAECAALYEDYMASMARIKQKIAAMFNRYEKMGVSPDAVKYTYRLANHADGAALHRQRTLTAARLGAIEYGGDGQGDFSAAIHATKPSQEAITRLSVARAYGDAYNTGLIGGTVDACPHHAGTEEFVRWQEGFSDGHEDRISRNPELENVSLAEPRKRGRPPGSKNKPKEVTGEDEDLSPGQTDIEEHIEAASIH